ncbi:probable methylthioribulose-1-phosphate dehydratase [Sitodiplosis mosellana]|uniref:probable methylthioribulose-1-phosphate dehydratase n=1 Tax=Sitodiplosis mosellana TaxID=263140 RepID=UPI002443F315|nr:probable methylthioribulose-1-phosphate dehydratase [Sitodiplosis mosellana]XP_055324354.1 probable methylthioribulose-1-phosphate dehydratase [Sitodiplosis mosellana]
MDYSSEGATEIAPSVVENKLFEPFVIPFNEWRAAKINTTMHIHTVDILAAGEICQGDRFSFSGYTSLELLKDWVNDRFYSFNNTVSIPVIPNDVDDTLKQRILVICGREEPLYPAVIVKGRGLFIWGDELKQTMRACEAIVTLLGIKLKVGATN